MRLSNASLRRRLRIAPLAEHKGRSLLSILAIALGVALGYAVQLINHVAVNEFSQAVQALSGQADLQIRRPRGGFDEALYPEIARMSEVAVASPVLEVEAKVAGGDDHPVGRLPASLVEELEHTLREQFAGHPRAGPRHRGALRWLRPRARRGGVRRHRRAWTTRFTS